ncbi:uncharacterized protein RHOBADRAFT_56453 [Rhodotorula graminis WP1]|uniref:F-box domain-containing protein n=1 Tax=Rhodotorula graminis (strain WP1) TaxID=578459 RepID=A0A0P9GFM3_RHOGW|nr:uncharacterized protein RHOBADRAFT_56453 [Rhodotorula graminis WP1]KPV71602.1 hypothetical protein RHOBADRAFT_56453 [Rhodotorula graminis WP1]
MVLAGRTHVWPLNSAAPDLSVVAPLGLVQPVVQLQQPVQQLQQHQLQPGRPRRPARWFRLMALPLELIHVILSYLETPDILAISCTSRAFANLLRRSGDRRALKVWTQARINMEVPKLSSDLRAGGDDVAAEVLLARLIGGTTCQVCGGEARHADLDARTRVCMTCASSLFMRTQQISQAHPYLHPRTLECAFDTWDVEADPVIDEFFLPDVLAISARLTSIAAHALGAGVHPDIALGPYITRRINLRARVYFDARTLGSWLRGRALRAAQARKDRLGRRQQQLYAKLAALGFAQDSYDYDSVWDELIEVCHEPSVPCEGEADRQERKERNDNLKAFCSTDEPLDDDEWDVFKDRIVAWIERNRRERRERKKNYAHNWQRRALKPLYNDVQLNVDDKTLPFLLPLSSFLRLPSLCAEWQWVGPLRIEVYAQKFSRMLPAAVADALEAVRNDRLVLLDRIARTLLADGDPLPSSIDLALSSAPSPFLDRDPRTGVEPAWAAISPADADALLERAVALFRCGVCGLLGRFAQLVPHVHASHGMRAPPRCLVAPAHVRALVRSAAGATTTADECEKMGRVWEISSDGGGGGGAGGGGDGGAAARPWKLKGQTWAEVMHQNFLGVTALKVGRTLRRSTLEGPGAPLALPTPSPSAEHGRVRVLGFDAGEYTETAWAWT